MTATAAAQPTTYPPTEACAECQGKCCKRLPGAWYPQDIPGELTPENIAEFVLSGKACFDWWEGDPRPQHDELSRGLFLRPHTADNADIAIDPAWGGRCIHLQSHGCALAFDERPLGCRLLEPRPDDKCISHGSDKDDAAIAWLECGTLLEDAIAAVEDGAA